MVQVAGALQLPASLYFWEPCTAILPIQWKMALFIEEKFNSGK
jgi:hypothetical protein